MASTTKIRQPFRFAAPVSARRQGVLRPRLVELLAGRHGRRLTTVVAGAGFGKTTLLAQALEQNQIDQRGRDVWLGLTRADGSADHLLAGLADALGIDTAVEPSVDAVLGAVWRSAPTEVALVLDDLHLVPDPSPGLDVVLSLLERLPVNGHLVVAARPPAARVLALADLVLGESDLAFDVDEMTAFALARAAPPEVVAASGGWPALAELRAGAGEEVAEDFLWEEILGRLEPWRRTAIEQLLAFGSFDDELVATVTGRDVTATALVEDLPLVDRDGAAVRLHDLWQRAGSRRSSPDAGIRRGAELLQGQGRFREAFDVLDRVGDAEAIADLVARLAVLDLPEMHADDFADVLGRAPAPVRAGPHAALLRAQMLLGVDGAGARASLADAAAGFAAMGDVDGEARALAHKLWLHSWDADLAAMGEVLARLEALSETGNERARRSVDLTSAYLALVAGEPSRAISIIEEGTILDDPTTAAVGGFILASGRLDLGQVEPALLAATEARRHARGRLRVGVIGAEFEARLLIELPEPEVVRSWMDELASTSETYGVAENQAMVQAGLAMVSAEYGWVEDAEQQLAEARRAEEVVGARVRPAITMAAAAVHLAADDEATATAVLRAGLTLDPLGERPGRAYLRSLASLYVLLPEAREIIDHLDLGPAWAYGRDLAQRIVAQRAGGVGAARGVSWQPVGRVRGALSAPFVVELAVGGIGDGDEEARSALDSLPFDIRPALRRLVGAGPSRVADVARDLLADVPAPPASTLEVGVLGPLELRRDGEAVRDTAWTRDRVRAVLQLLVEHRTISRRRAADLIWPDLDAVAAADNLRVNLTHLQHLLQPDRRAEEAPWFVISDEDRLVLRPSSQLQIDVDRFDAEVADGREAERDLDPIGAIRHYRSALRLYRGDYLVDAMGDDWGEAERARLRRVFVDVAVRAGELLVADGACDEAVRLAGKATEVDPFTESAWRLSARALRLSGDRAAAWRLLSSAVERLRDEGLEPEAETLRDLQDLADPA